MPSTDAAVAATRESWIPRGAVPRVVPLQMCGLLEEVVWPGVRGWVSRSTTWRLRKFGQLEPQTA